MPTVALIGGIGCGKSTVTDLLAARGAAVVDADEVAREIVAPGSPQLADLVVAFGAAILAPDGTLDRPALAAVAFATPAATATLNAITHPAIGAAIAAAVDDARGRADVVVVAIPLFRAELRDALCIDEVVCVDCAHDVALRRLVTSRGFDRADAERRMRAQATRADRIALADTVLTNDGSLEALTAQVDALWIRLAARG